jgi:hypothetical protein
MLYSPCDNVDYKMPYMNPIAAPKYRAALFILIILFLGVGAYNLYYSFPYAGPNEQLLASPSIFSTTWILDGTAQEITEWSNNNGGWANISETEIATDPILYQNIGGGLWLAADGYRSTSTISPNLYIGQVLKRHIMPIEAFIKLQVISPGKPETWNEESFRGRINQPALRPNTTIVTKYATSQRVECLAGSLKACEMWYIWLQYGEYLLQINIQDIGRGVDTSTIEALIAKIDDDVGQKLRFPKQ